MNDVGEAAQTGWLSIPDHFPDVVLDAFVVMPNHVHGVFFITPPDRVDDDDSMIRRGEKFFAPTENQNMDDMVAMASGGAPVPGTSRTVGSVVRGFKIGVTKWARQNTRIHTIWQRNYYEHIIRDTEALTSIRRYIAMNPSNWATDEDYRGD